MKYYPAQNVNSVKTEKPYTRESNENRGLSESLAFVATLSKLRQEQDVGQKTPSLSPLAHVPRAPTELLFRPLFSHVQLCNPTDSFL